MHFHSVIAPGGRAPIFDWRMRGAAPSLKMEGRGTAVLTDLPVDAASPLDIAMSPQAVLRIDLRGAAASAKRFYVHACHRKPGPWRSAFNSYAHPDEAAQMVRGRTNPANPAGPTSFPCDETIQFV